MIESRKTRVFYGINYALITLVVLTMVVPLINIIATSFSGERAVLSGEVFLWPVDFTTETYKQVFFNSPLMRGMRNTLTVTFVGTALNMVMTLCAAYPLSKPRLQGRTFFLLMITLTMILNAGIVPNFLLVKDLGLMNSFWAIWLPGVISTYNMIVMKTFLQSLPPSLEESAMIDGANDMTVLIRIILPLSLPSLATITLFYAVGHWNSYFNVMLYISKSNLKTLQLVLRDLINNSSVTDMLLNASRDSSDFQVRVTQESIKAASIVIATLPIMCVYPFLQKYFVKGVMIGSVKG